MGTPRPSPWTFAARAAYFGDRMCAFCDHRNPSGAKFCNDCAAPLHLKPCEHCGAINDHAATHCYQCGGACSVSPGVTEATPVLPAADTVPAATPGGSAAATVTQPRLDAPALRAAWRLLSAERFLMAAIAAILIVGAYEAYRVGASTFATMRFPSEPVAAPENRASAAAPAGPMASVSTPAAPETTAGADPPIAATNADAPPRTSPRPSAARASTTKRTKAPSRPVPPQRQAAAGAPGPVAHHPAAARAGLQPAQTSKASRPDPMRVSLARCDGDLITRIVCDQRVRRDFCEGHWGEAPECAGGISNEHGQ